mmetsp:Transcript_25612/g.35374  ORF Transcript_25612/g.35374 Transcript_25612/m.35374 type:complete len:149 (-) Transcript_25612:280-726(-)|eukprot:CAMPEP_0196586750 /NCGR_PEP_ID=MMETSP1081-20130531/55422_1 /TAXON_ID=36882 /ORGANISM="Pyramimonas amylifera, Strain CCMP720" /LENGTH=148 /DNA_ID=CAMNT_0041908729 /DNA_START=257 /DNA_END=703 /DNA_ORIENTATION=+
MSELNEVTDASGVIFFDKPLPPIRVPCDKNGDEDGPSLCFKDDGSRLIGLSSCLEQTQQRCMDGASPGCAEVASRSCGGKEVSSPWWKRWRKPVVSSQRESKSWEEREACENEVMNACLQSSRPKCGEYAMEICYRAYQEPLIRKHIE